MTNKMLGSLCSVSAIALVFCSSPSFAQDATAGDVSNPPVATAAGAAPTDGGLGDIVVTAQRTEQNLQRTPVSVTALSSGDLTRLQIHNAKDLGQAIPNVSITQVTGGSAGLTPYIRGGGTTDGANITSEPEVGVYVDDVYQPSMQASFLDALDIDRIEVLRGPQGTLYGRNTSAGALKIITRAPGDQFSLKSEVGTGTWGEYDGKLATSGPVTKDGHLRAGFSGAFSTREGGRQNDPTLGHDVGAQKYQGFQSELYYVDSVIKARLKGFYSHYSSDGLYASAIDPLTTSTDYKNLPLTSGSYRTVLSPTPAFTTDRNYGTSLNVTADLAPHIQFASISSWQKLIDAWRLDFGGGVDNALLGIATPGYSALYDRTSHSHQTALSQEFQLRGSVFDGKIDFVTGLYYFRQSGSQQVDTLTFFVPDTSVFGITTNSYAAFGQATYHITSKLSVTGGARYTEDHKSLDASLDGTLVDRKDKFHNLLPKAALEYQALPQLLIYASYTKGFKAGGYNGLASTAAALNSPYDSQKVTAYEIGIKSEFLDRHVRLNLAGFINDYTGLQQQSVTSDGVFLTENYKARHKGIESELTVKATQDLTLWVNGVYNDGKYTGGGDYSGNRMTNVFKYQSTVGADYGFDLGRGRVSFGGNYMYRSDYFASPDNSYYGHVKPVGLVDAYAAYSINRWELRIAGKNLTNETYWTTGFGFSVIRPRFIADPRTWRLSLSYKL